jgi:hypothetical protein
MKNKHGSSIYIPSDKNLYDVLQDKRVKQSDALKFLRGRGIFVSSKLNKTELSKIISQLTFDYHDYIFLTKLLENPNRKEKITNTILKTSSNNDEFIKTCQMLQKNNDSSDSYKVEKRENSVVLIATYIDIDLSRTELKQRTVRKCEIELQADGDNTIVRMPATEKGREITDKFKMLLSEIKDEKFEEEMISLENIINPEARSFFFDTLIKSIPGYQFDDVTNVNVCHEIDTLEEEDDDERSSHIAGFIKNAALTGEGVLVSKEFKQLHSDGFFISKIVWTVIDPLPDGDKIELEAQFGNPKSCTDFKYLVRVVFNYNEKTASHNVSRRSPSRIETDTLNIKLEKAAKIAFNKVIEKYEVQ